MNNYLNLETEYLVDLLQHMLNGVTVHKVILNELGEPIDLIYVTANEAFETHFELKREEVIGKKLTEVIPEITQTEPNLIEIYGNVALTGVKEILEFYFTPLEKWFHVTAYSPSREHIVTVTEDITKRKVQELELLEAKESLESHTEELEQLNQRYNLAVKGSDVGIWQWNMVTDELIWSDRLFSLLGYQPQEFTPTFQYWSSLIHPDDKKSVMNSLNDHLKYNKPYVIEHRIKCKDGKFKWIKGSGSTKRNERGEVLNMAGSLDDINQQKEAELANKRLLELLDASSDFIGQADSNKNITYLNPAFKKLIGFGQEGRNDIPDWHPPEDLKKLDEVIFPETLKHGSWQGEINITDIDGNIIPCSLLELGHKNSKGEYETFSAIFRDISDLKKQETELLKQTKISEHQSKLAAIGQLAAGVGHEINNPVAIIKGYVESLLSELSSDNQINREKMFERLKKIDTTIERVSKITEGLRSFARNDSEQAEYISVGNIVQDSCSLVQEIYKNDGIRLQLNNLSYFYDAYIFANKGKFQQILMNLLSNAKDAVEHTNVKEIVLDLCKAEGFITLSIQDTGIGIEKSNLDKIFDPFYTTKDVNKGTGLGLSFVSEYIQEMMGTIEVSSDEGKSTTFKIQLPEAHPGNNELSSHSEQPPVSNSVDKLNILVVDDEVSLCEIHAEMLSIMGHTVATAHNGLEALNQLSNAAKPFDLVITDMRMPEMGGLELVKQTKATEFISQPKFIIMTGGVDVDIDAEDQELRNLVDGFLYKPFKGKELIDSVNQLFN